MHRQRKESLTTVSFAVAQFDSSQKPYVAFGNVPIEDGHDLEDLTFAGSTGQARAVIQFARSNFPIGGQQCSVCCRWPMPAFWQANCMSWPASQQSLVNVNDVPFPEGDEDQGQSFAVFVEHPRAVVQHAPSDFWLNGVSAAKTRVQVVVS